MKNNIDSIYRLTKNQVGMVFDTQISEVPGYYTQQLICDISGDFDQSRFHDVWLKVIGFYPELRVAIVSKKDGEYVQVVMNECSPEWGFYDVCDDNDQNETIDDYLTFDREKGFSLNKAPLMRFAIFKHAANSYKFIWTLHHAIMDGWSAAIVLRSVFEAYNGSFSFDTSPPKFESYINWMEAINYDKERKYWFDVLCKSSSTFVFKKNKGLLDTKLKSHQFTTMEFMLDESLSSSLVAYAKSEKVSLNSVYQAAWSLLLSLYSYNDNVTYGLTIAGRQPGFPDSDKIVGLFVNTLPINITINLNTLSFSDLVNKVSATASDAGLYGGYSLADIKKDNNINVADNLFDSIIVFEDYFGHDTWHKSDSGFEIDNFRFHGQTNTSLALIISHSDRTRLRFQFRSSEVEEKTIHEIFNYFLNILKEGVSKNNSKLSNGKYLSKSDEAKIISKTNDKALSGYCGYKSIVAMFSHTVSQYPNNTAVIDEKISYSYEKLNNDSNILASVLIEEGVSLGGRVGVCLDRSYLSVVSFVAILKAGAAYVPLYTKNPTLRMQKIIDDSKISCLLSDSGTFPFVVDLGLNYIDVHKVIFSKKPQECAFAPILNDEDDVAYIMYTSGSTGEPKGVVVSHKSVLSLVDQPNYVEIKKSDVIAHASNISFDASTFEIWGSLLNGATLSIIDDAELLDFEELKKSLIGNRVSTLFITTAYLNKITSYDGTILKGLENLLFGGEKANVTAIRSLLSEDVNNLIHVYGPTEATTFSLFHKIDDEIFESEDVPLGRPINYSKAYLLDKNNCILPFGSVGELVLAGDGVMLGYNNTRELSQDSIIIKNIECEDLRLYKTGDLARQDSEGNFFYIGRTDGQVKISGFRIEIGDIDSVVRSHPDIDDTYVFVSEGVNGNDAVFLVVNRSSEVLSELDLRNYMRERLPAYMMPEKVYFMEDFPLTQNGKVDKAFILKSLSSEEVIGEVKISKDNSTIHGLLSDVFSDVLEIEDIDLDGNLFDLGGSSLIFVEAVNILKHREGLEISVIDLFEYPTINMLCEYLEGRPMG